MDKEQQILNSLASLRSVLEKPEVQPKPWYEVVRTWLPTILLVIGAIYSVVGPWNSINIKLNHIEEDVKVIQWVLREENEQNKEWIDNPFLHRGPGSASIMDIPKPYEQFNCIIKTYNYEN